MDKNELLDQFKEDCRVVSMANEYPGYVGEIKWIIFSSLAEEELRCGSAYCAVVGGEHGVGHGEAPVRVGVYEYSGLPSHRGELRRPAAMASGVGDDRVRTPSRIAVQVVERRIPVRELYLEPVADGHVAQDAVQYLPSGFVLCVEMDEQFVLHCSGIIAYAALLFAK